MLFLLLAMPPLPPTFNPRQADIVPAILPANNIVSILISNAPVDVPQLHKTGVVGTTNLCNWYRLACSTYQIGVFTVMLSNRPPAEFYKAFNR